MFRMTLFYQKEMNKICFKVNHQMKVKLKMIEQHKMKKMTYNQKNLKHHHFLNNKLLKKKLKKKMFENYIIHQIIKDTCLEKIKGYIGFGRSELILNEKIGSIFLLPISSNWTFKM